MYIYIYVMYKSLRYQAPLHHSLPPLINATVQVHEEQFWRTPAG